MSERERPTRKVPWLPIAIVIALFILCCSFSLMFLSRILVGVGKAILPVDPLTQAIGDPVSLFLGSFGLIGWLVLLVLLIIGIIIVIVIVKMLLFVLPAAIIAFVVWLLTGGNEVLAGIAFIAVCLLSILKR